MMEVLIMTTLSKQEEIDEERLFLRLMRLYMEAEGKRLLAENKRLKADPSAEVPPELDRKCLELIQRHFDNGT